MIRQFILVLAALFIITLPAVADNISDTECILDKAAIKPALLVNKDDSEGFHTITRKSRQLSESLQLKNGMTIEFSVGGCAHYGYSFRFINIPQQITQNNKNPVDIALAVMDQVSLQADQEHLKSSFKETLKNALKTPQEMTDGSIFLECGDAICTLDVENNGNLSLNYDFPL